MHYSIEILDLLSLILTERTFVRSEISKKNEDTKTSKLVKKSRSLQEEAKCFLVQIIRLASILITGALAGFCYLRQGL